MGGLRISPALVLNNGQQIRVWLVGFVCLPAHHLARLGELFEPLFAIVHVMADEPILPLKRRGACSGKLLPLKTEKLAAGHPNEKKPVLGERIWLIGGFEESFSRPKHYT